jgi:hypothetical protein
MRSSKEAPTMIVEAFVFQFSKAYPGSRDFLVSTFAFFQPGMERNNRGSAKANDKKMLRSDVMDLHQNDPVRLA